MPTIAADPRPDDSATETTTDRGGSPVNSGDTDSRITPGNDTTVVVVASIIFDPERRYVLLSKRLNSQHQGGLWEFPGGKVEAGESLDAALNRELAEELGIAPLQSTVFDIIEHTYPDKTVRIHFLSVLGFAGSPVGREGQVIGWFGLDKLDTLSFPEANRPIVERLIQSR